MRVFLQWGLLGALSLSVLLFFLFINFYPVGGFFEEGITESTKIYDRNGVLLYETLYPGRGRTDAVDFENFPDFLLEATLATEDERFYQHRGVDPVGLVRAVFQNLREGRVVSGASTITQQLVRNELGTEQKRSVFQKAKEALLALRIERVYSKEEILHLYLNKIYYGNLNYGVGSASYGYFDKDLSSLDLSELAFLAGLPQAPNRYDPFEDAEAALARRDYVLELMFEKGAISGKEREAAQSQELDFESNLLEVKAPHFVNYVLGELEDRYGPDFVSAGYEVQTSLDYYLYEQAVDIARRQLSFLTDRNVSNAAAVVLDPHTSEIIVMMGSVDYFDASIDGEVNVALQLRQPGSALKPITYALAFERGMYGGTLLEDEPVRFFTAEGNPYLPKNFDFEYHGTVTAREALANSYNIPAVLLADYLGVGQLLDRLRAMGLSTLNQSADHYGLALTLGAGEVRLLDLTATYMAFANEGLLSSPQSLLAIHDREGELLYNASSPPTERVLEEGVASMITHILSDPLARIPEFGTESVLDLGWPAAVKTGTTREFRDNWTMGYSPDYVVGVWVGNNDNSPMLGVSGVDGAGPIWHDIMQELHRKQAKPDFVYSHAVHLEGSELLLNEGPSLITHLASASGEGRGPLRILQPHDLDQFQVQSRLQSEVQRLKFTATHEEELDLTELEWWVNGEFYASGAEVYWELEPGEFDLEARLKLDQVDRIKFFVE